MSTLTLFLDFTVLLWMVSLPQDCFLVREKSIPIPPHYCSGFLELTCKNRSGFCWVVLRTATAVEQFTFRLQVLGQAAATCRQVEPYLFGWFLTLSTRCVLQSKARHHIGRLKFCWCTWAVWETSLLWLSQGPAVPHFPHLCFSHIT